MYVPSHEEISSLSEGRNNYNKEWNRIIYRKWDKNSNK